jgi:hypothetical protein
MLMRRLQQPGSWHFASLVTSATILVLLAPNQWFFFDEWAFLVPEATDELLAPHNGHWSTSPILITRLLTLSFGMDSYWPFILASMAVHLLLCHVLWRLMLRTSANPWIVTALTFLLMLLGAGFENIFWAFQVGYMGAILLALIVALLLDRPEMTPWIAARIVGVSILSLTFSGTALAVLFAAGLVGINRHGLARTLRLLGASALIYIAWWLIFVRGSPSPFGPTDRVGIFVGIPQYVGHMFVDGLGRVLPVAGFGAIAVASLLIWTICSYSKWRGPNTVAYALLAAAGVQAILTGFSRVALGTESASSSRYIYSAVLLLLPVIALAFTDAARRRRPVIAAIVVLTLFTTSYNSVVLSREALAQAPVEIGTRERVYAVIDLAARGATLDDLKQPDPTWAPNLTVKALEEMVDLGWLSSGPYSREALLGAELALLVNIDRVSDQDLTECEALTLERPVAIGTDTAGKLAVFSLRQSPVTLRLYNNGASAQRAVTLEEGTTLIVWDDFRPGSRLEIEAQEEAVSRGDVCVVS